MLILLAALACRTDEKPVAVDSADPTDLDGDGYGADEDCDNEDANVYPGAAEEQDLADNDCDGLVDEDLVRAGDVLITEVMAAPSSELGEYIELENVTEADLDLVGWTLAGQTFEDNLVLPAGETLVLGQSRDRDANGGIFVDVLLPELSLGDEGDSLVLAVADTVVFALDYGEDDGLRAGSAIGLDPDFADGEAEHWCRQRTDLPGGDEGTPNAANDVCRHLDHDGDGYSWEDGDCDDEDGSVSPAVAERWDWADSDCNGYADDLAIDEVDHAAWTFGYAYPGYGSNLGQGDLDGDGTDEAVIGGYSGVMVVHTDAAGGEASEAALSWLSSGYYNYLGAVPPRAGDLDGDGQDDLAVGAPDGTYTYNYYDEEDDPVGVVSLFLGTTLSDSKRLDPEDADRSVSGQQPGSWFGQSLYSFDFGGDGADDLVVSDPDLFEVVLVEN